MKSLRSISWFGLVGACAALVHYVSAVVLEAHEWLSPAYANFVAFLIAFLVSYFGHRYLSFAGNVRSHLHALPRFLTVAIAGFTGNQILLLGLLQHSQLPFWIALGIVMLVIAIATFFSSKYWAFRHG